MRKRLHFLPLQVTEYKVNAEDVFRRAKKAVQDLQDEKQTLEIQREEVHQSCCVCLPVWTAFNIFVNRIFIVHGSFIP